MGDSQSEAPRPSISQKKSTSVWSDSNSNVAVVDSLGSAGKATSVVSGGVSTVHSWCAGVWSRLPARSVARTSKECAPGSTSYSAGDSHSANGSLSSEHSNVAPASEANVNAATVDGLGSFGADRILVSGASVSGAASTGQV